MTDPGLNSAGPNPGALDSPADGLQAELRRTVAMLLATQQSLIDLRHRRDRELRVLEGIVHFSELALPGAADEEMFWDSAVETATETFECEFCLAVELEDSRMRVLASRGPDQGSTEEILALGAVISRNLQGNSMLLEGEALAGCTLAGGPLGTLMLAAISKPEMGPWRALLAAVSARKQVFFPTFDSFSVPGLRMFANHLHVVYETLRARQRIAAQLEELDSSHNALEQANASLEERIAEQHRVEAALRESEAKYRHLFEDSADGMALLEIDTLVVLDCNPALCKLTERTRYALLGKPISELLAPRKGDAATEPARDRREGELLVLQDQLRTAHSHTVPVEIRVSQLRVDGREFRLCIFHDLSHRRRAEEEQERLRSQLAQSRKMESIGRLAGGVAHDFNNLLTVICGYSEMLQSEPNLEQYQQEQLREILDASNRAKALTQQLLMFSRKQVMRPAAADMNQVISASLRIYGRLLGEDISLQFAPCSEATPILADTQQLDQILGNLLINARDAIHACKPPAKTREILIRTALVPSVPSSPTQGPHVQMSVRDTGAGMDRATLQSIFEPFFTTKDVGKGTGLGLATVFGVVQQNKGVIEVESAPGEGATFTVYWPLRKEEAQAPATATTTKATNATGREQVLLVEDDHRVREFTVQGLRTFGYEVVAAENGPRALDLLANGKLMPAILVTDVVMPEMNGRELAEAVQLQRPGLPVLFISGYTDDIVAQHGILRDGVALLEKPFSTSALALKIRSLLDGRANPAQPSS